MAEHRRVVVLRLGLFVPTLVYPNSRGPFPGCVSTEGRDFI